MSLKTTVKKLQEKFGEGAIRVGSELPPVQRMLSNLPAINYVTCGGYPIGRIIEHVGDFSSLKSYAAYDLLAEFQHYDWNNNIQKAFSGFTYKGEGLDRKIVSATYRKGLTLPKKAKSFRAKRVALIDVEKTYTKDWGEHMGIDNDGLLYSKPASLEEAADICEALLSEEDIGLVVLDSMSIIGTDNEVSKSMEDAAIMGGAAAFWNRALRKFMAAMNRNPNWHEVTLLLINSTYNKVGVVFGDPEVVRNGSQLKLSKSVSIHFKGLKEITGEYDGQKDVVLGRNVKVKCLKNKVGVSGRTSEFFYSYVDTPTADARTTDTVYQLIAIAHRYGIIERKGHTYKYGKLSVKGADNFAIKLRESKSDYQALFTEVSQAIKVGDK